MKIEPQSGEEAIDLLRSAYEHLSTSEVVDFIGVKDVLECIDHDKIVKHVGADALLDAICERDARKYFGIVE